MRVVFLGTGEAFGRNANTSLLIDERILLDCGFTSLMQLRKISADLLKIGVVVITHLHADHYFGLPPLLLASYEEGRREELIIIAPPGGEDAIEQAMRLAYHRSLEELGYEIRILPTQPCRFQGYSFEFCKNNHSVEAYSVFVSSDRKIVYTGDGIPTQEFYSLARECHLMVAEAYHEGKEGHSSPRIAAEMAKKVKARRLALVHLFRGINREEIEMARRIFPELFVPDDLDTLEI